MVARERLHGTVWILIWTAMETAQDMMPALMSRIGQLETVVTGKQQLLQVASERSVQQQAALQTMLDQSQ
jgi:hypothetical protein